MTTTLAPAAIASPAAAPTPAVAPATASFVVFSGELDKLLVAFTLANAAAAGGLRTTMFFTFWSLAALRQPHAATGKGLVERMFGWMLPRGTGRLPMSKLNFAGFGSRLVRWRMKRQGFASLEDMIASARALGVRFVVCETSMQVMGFRREEMPAGAEFAGAAECVANAADARVAMIV
jgi:peroxiredoxin family protein